MDTEEDQTDIAEERVACIRCIKDQYISSKMLILDITTAQVLSEDFIRKLDEKNGQMNWKNICTYLPLTEQFIREHKDKVFWVEISAFQKLSEDFIREFKDSVHWENILEYQHLSEEFLRECREAGFIGTIDNWLYETEEFKKQEIEKTGLYECHDDYFIAYKGIRKDRYSNFNFQYRYFPGETYEVFADGSCGENSFGLSVGTKEEAKKYCRGLIVKAKIYYRDVARVVYGGERIRCSKITILE